MPGHTYTGCPTALRARGQRAEMGKQLVLQRRVAVGGHGRPVCAPRQYEQDDEPNDRDNPLHCANLRYSVRMVVCADVEESMYAELPENDEEMEEAIVTPHFC